MLAAICKGSHVDNLNGAPIEPFRIRFEIKQKLYTTLQNSSDFLIHPTLFAWLEAKKRHFIQGLKANINGVSIMNDVLSGY